MCSNEEIIAKISSDIIGILESTRDRETLIQMFRQTVIVLTLRTFRRICSDKVYLLMQRYFLLFFRYSTMRRQSFFLTLPNIDQLNIHLVRSDRREVDLSLLAFPWLSI